MTENVAETDTAAVGLNKNIDLGCLLVEDC